MLQEGIDAALSGDTLVVKGTCTGVSTISKNLTLKGVSNNPFGVATLDGVQLDTVLTITGAVTVHISGLVITGGLSTSGGGGGIKSISPGSSVTLFDSVVTNNFGLFTGGGISNNGVMRVTRSTIASNRVISVSSVGGGIFSVGTLTVDRSTISHNISQGRGGGVENWYGTVTITDSQLSDNRSWFGGGLVNLFGGRVTVVDTTIANNTASQGGLDGDGGGILNQGSVLTLTRSTLRGNTARDGGGIFNDGAVTLSDSTVTANSVSDVGGGVYNFGVGVVTLAGTSSIIGNTPDNCFPPGSIAGCV